MLRPFFTAEDAEDAEDSKNDYRTEPELYFVNNKSNMLFCCGEHHWDVQLRLHGEVRTDVINGFAHSFLFITDPVVKLLNEKQFTGWGTYPVEIVGEIQPAEPIYGRFWDGWDPG